MPLTEPLGLIWLLMSLSVVWLLIRRQWRTALWLSVPTILISLVGCTPLAEALVGHEEARWAGASASRYVADSASATEMADAVVVLGGGYYPSDHDVFGMALTGAASRLLTGIELIRQKKAKSLVFGGAVPVPGKPGFAAAQLPEHWFLTTSVAHDGGPAESLGTCANTHEEALRFKELQKTKGWRSVLLVTSALHMRRSQAVFRKLNIFVTPVACDFQVEGASRAELSNKTIMPRKKRFELLSDYMHEKIGSVVYRLRGWI